MDSKFFPDNPCKSSKKRVTRGSNFLSTPLSTRYLAIFYLLVFYYFWKSTPKYLPVLGAPDSRFLTQIILLSISMIWNCFFSYLYRFDWTENGKFFQKFLKIMKFLKNALQNNFSRLRSGKLVFSDFRW